MKVKQVMHVGVQWVHPDTSVNKLAALMRDRDIGAIPIVLASATVPTHERALSIGCSHPIAAKSRAQSSAFSAFLARITAEAAARARSEQGNATAAAGQPC